MVGCTQRNDERMMDFIDRIKQTFNQTFIYEHCHEFFKFRRGVQKAWLREGMCKRYWELAHIEDDYCWEELIDAAQDAEWLHYLLNPKPWQRPVDQDNDGDFNIDSDDFAIVYTDGCCFCNGQPNARAGIGVWFGKHHHLNVSEPLEYDDEPTNQTAELRAVLRAVEIARDHYADRLVVRTDSEYLINSLTKWVKTWLSNGWRTAVGGYVRHRDLFREYWAMTEDMTVVLEHVCAHRNHYGNEMADLLAKRGASKY